MFYFWTSLENLEDPSCFIPFRVKESHSLSRFYFWKNFTKIGDPPQFLVFERAWNSRNFGFGPSLFKEAQFTNKAFGLVRESLVRRFSPLSCVTSPAANLLFVRINHLVCESSLTLAQQTYVLEPPFSQWTRSTALLSYKRGNRTSPRSTVRVNEYRRLCFCNVFSMFSFILALTGGCHVIVSKYVFDERKIIDWKKLNRLRPIFFIHTRINVSSLEPKKMWVICRNGLGFLSVRNKWSFWPGVVPDDREKLPRVIV